MDTRASSIGSTKMGKFFLDAWKDSFTAPQLATEVFILSFQQIVFFLLHWLETSEYNGLAENWNITLFDLRKTRTHKFFFPK